MRRLATVFALALAVAGCGSAGTQSGSAPPSDQAGAPAAAASSTAAPAGDRTGSTVPFATVPAVGGGQIDGADLAGRDLALWFWAPW